MKITIDVECTPAEARQFFGLPDLTPIHEAALDEMKKHMASASGAFDPETMMKSWFSAGSPAFDQMQRMMWGAAGASPKRDPSGD